LKSEARMLVRRAWLESQRKTKKTRWRRKSRTVAKTEHEPK
jgi:hypothetical protein